VRRLLIVPAAGRGSRLGGQVPKPLVQVNGRPMLEYLAALYAPAVETIVVVAHPAFAPEVRAWAATWDRIQVVEQPQPTGMLDAICLATPAVHEIEPDTIWITWADQIGVLPETVQRLAEAEAAPPAAAMTLPTVATPDPYIHFERDASGRIVRLLQRREGDTLPATGESDMGLFALSRATFVGDLQEYAEGVTEGTVTGERNFLPFVPWLAARRTVRTIPCSDPRERIGVNTPEELALVADWLRSERRA
jgi:bifunctional UDP-N-acetylglucosamine pyrophosphorylase / glucosamine-1-phosphate N-acetyltransferase